MDNTIQNIAVDLAMFARLPPNTQVHLNRNNRFIITAKNMPYMLGAQTLANICKGHTTQKLIKDLHVFFQHIVNVLNNNDNTIISVICRDFKLAYSGLPEFEYGGMRGLLQTYKTDPSIKQLSNVLSFMTDSIKYFEKYIDLDKCPEEDFDDDKWIKAMKKIPLLDTEYVGLTEYYINYSIPLTLNQLLYDDINLFRWTEVHVDENNGAKVIFGALPIIVYQTGRNDCTDIVNLGVGAVLSMNKKFETMSTGYVYSIVTYNDWLAHNIFCYQLPTSDYCSVHLEIVQIGVEYINWAIQKGISIYVHCKSGKSRSLLIVAAYFVKYLGYTSDGAIKLLTSLRTQAGFGPNSTKMDTLKMYESIVTKTKNLKNI
jgi:hypothetical protein